MRKLGIKKGLFLGLGLCALLVFTGCHKEEGPGGEAEFKVVALQPDSLELRTATFYLKYGAEKFPGKDLSLYDAHVSGNGHRMAQFTGLRQGDYYVYCVASANGTEMTGGKHVRVWLRRQSGLVSVSVKP
jgi:hypothetical protein